MITQVGNMVGPEQALAFFQDDVPEGWLIQCQHCGTDHISPWTPPAEPLQKEFCPGCGYELLYPSGASW